MDFLLDRRGNSIRIVGVLAAEHLRLLLASIFECVVKRGYSEVTLDFEACTAAFPVAMLPLCAHVLQLKSEGVVVELNLPREDRAKRLFVNSNWAGLISDQYPLDTFKGYLQIPATRFIEPQEQRKIVDRVMASLLRSTPDFKREDFAAIEWALSEITDNVINHAHSSVGGLIQFSSRHTSKRVDFVVCDAGAGIPATLMPSYPQINTELDALGWAIREGITRDPKNCQGNGLFGSSEIARRSGGYFRLDSGHASLFTNEPTSLRLKNERIPLKGAVVDVCLSYAVPDVLASALKFDELGHKPIDYIFSRFQADAVDGELIFKIREESDGVTSRPAAKPVRQQLLNLYRVTTDRININFDELTVVSSSFADEAIGKLIAEIGLDEFRKRFRLHGLTPTVQSILARAVSQRLRQSVEI